MSVFIKDGGPAFPSGTEGYTDYLNDSRWVNERQSANPGMTLRDWFAGQALVALFAQSANPASPGIAHGHYHDAASEAYDIADAMLAAREKRT